MHKWICCLLVHVLMALATHAQLSENFADGDFTSSPVWQGSTAEWTINPQLQLQTASTTPNSSFYLSTASTAALSTQWTFWVRLSFNTSSANYLDVYLTASAADLTAGSATGYFVRIGNTQDEISLYRKDPGGIVKLIDGVDGITNQSDNTFLIRVVRDSNGRFALLRDATANAANLQMEGTATDLTYTTSGFFGLLVRQSTSGFFGRHFFDNLLIEPYSPDLIPPSLTGIEARTATSLVLQFSEAVEPVTSQQTSRYVIDGGVGNPLSVARSIADARQVELTLATPLLPDRSYTLSLQGIQDVWGNASGSQGYPFIYSITRRHDVLITEVMADPSPPVALPQVEYIELKNVSGRPVQLEGWRLHTATSSSSAFPSYTLLPDSFVVVAGNSAAVQLSTFAPTMGVSNFPSLPNESSLLLLQSREGVTIHVLAYTAAWYRNSPKKEGGWSLEMIDIGKPCMEAQNWMGSEHPSGGTPGRINSVTGSVRDSIAPALLRAFSTDSGQVVVLFSEPVDSTAAALLSNYTFSPAVEILQATPLPPFNQVLLRLRQPLLPRTTYTIEARAISDCSGNLLTPHSVKAGRPEPATAGDVVINEVLFDPVPGQSDYVELYNRSLKVIDASALFISNRTATGLPGTPVRTTDRPFLIFPEDYLLLCEDTVSLHRQYLVKHPEATLQVSSLPGYPDDEGTVVVLNGSGEVLDEVRYSKDWHYPLLHNREGVALERLNPGGSSDVSSNWHSAAATAGWGTPGYRNSQWFRDSSSTGTVFIQPRVFSPDGDGQDDYALISYAVEAAGFTANIFIFDAMGRQVRHLVKNSPLGRKGSFKWDGLNEAGRPLSPGIYVVASQFFRLDGKKIELKNTVVLAVGPR